MRGGPSASCLIHARPTAEQKVYGPDRPVRAGLLTAAASI